MKWTGSIKAVQGIKAVQVEIKEDLHAAAKARASLLGIRVADLYADAIDRRRIRRRSLPGIYLGPATIPERIPTQSSEKR